MIIATSRSRLYELRRDRLAAVRSAELLERKREVLLRETLRRAAQRDALRAAVAAGYERAMCLLKTARRELGTNAVGAAALAQPEACAAEGRVTSLMGVRVADLALAPRPFRPVYGAAATAASLDDAARAFHELTADVLRLAGAERALTSVRLALRKTTKLVNALQKIVIPRVEHDIRTIVDSIEEDERDEGIRRKVHLAARRSGRFLSGPASPAGASSRKRT